MTLKNTFSEKKEKNGKRKSKNTKLHWVPYNKFFIDHASSVKIAEYYWPRSFFAFLWTSTSSTLKENLANTQPSWSIYI